MFCFLMLFSLSGLYKHTLQDEQENAKYEQLMIEAAQDKDLRVATYFIVQYLTRSPQPKEQKVIAAWQDRLQQEEKKNQPTNTTTDDV